MRCSSQLRRERSMDEVGEVGEVGGVPASVSDLQAGRQAEQIDTMPPPVVAVACGA